MKGLKWLPPILVMALLLSCAPAIKLAQFQTSPDNSVQLITPAQQKTELIVLEGFIIAVDGRYFNERGAGMKKVRISPGKHQVKIRMTGNVTKFGCRGEVKIALPAHQDPGAIALPYVEAEFEASKEYLLTYDVSIQETGALARVGGVLTGIANLLKDRHREEELPVTHTINVTNVKFMAQ